MTLEGNPTKGALPTWEMATFQTPDGLQLITVWRNADTGEMSAQHATRSSVSATWERPTRYGFFG